MKKQSVKILAVFLGLVFLGQVSFATTSNDFEKISEKQLQNILKEYKLKESVVNSLPSSIKPLEIKSSSELRTLLKQVTKPSNIIIQTPEIQSCAIGKSVYSKYVFSPYAYFNIRVNYEYLYDKKRKKNYYSKVNGVSSDMTGFTQWIDYVADSSLSTATIVNSGLGLKAHVEGTESFYLLINGVVKLFSLHRVEEYTFTNP